MFKSLSLTVIHLVILVLLVCTNAFFSEFSFAAKSVNVEQDPRKPMLSLKVRIVVDGDSLYLFGQQRQIRLWGVDAPERNKPGYWRARSALHQLVDDQRLSCFPKALDRYDRIVARCYLSPDSSGMEINRQLLKMGVAKEYCYFTRGFYGFCD